MTFQLLHGDCLEILPTLAADSIDAVVTDPPYGLSFMGKAWDYEVPKVAIWREVFRVLKPGGHLLSFFGTRTYHRGVVQIEDAGFDIRDCLAWMYGTGFPKSLNVGGGRGTALKPAHEPIVLARKPLVGTVAANVQAFGTGALNIDGCRVEGGSEYQATSRINAHQLAGPNSYQSAGSAAMKPGFKPSSGRWPANVLLDEQAAALLDEMSGESRSTDRPRHNTAEAHNQTGSMGKSVADWVSHGHADSGGASRFFYTAKAPREERDAGLELLDASSGGTATGRKDGSAGLKSPRAGAGRTGGARNTHPTVKPIDLMRWLVRLVTPPGGVVLDPFAGSASTGVACLHEGLRFVGIERDAEYFRMAKERLSAWAEVKAQLTTIKARAEGQMPLFAKASP